MVKAAKNSATQRPVLVKINEKWVNVTTWMRSHPGGSAPLERYDGQDATDAFAALHSADAWAQVEKMKNVDVDADVLRGAVPASKLSLAFRQFRAELAQEGFFERRWHRDAFSISLMLAWCALGFALAWRAPLLAILFLGLGMQQAGWIGHDYSHARGGAAWWISHLISPLVNGFSYDWWSKKHNTHHVHPNQRGVDDDIANDPVLHLQAPASPVTDVWFRAFQHHYYHIAYAFLYVSWRIQSFQTALRSRNWLELAPMLVNYAVLACLPLHVVVGAVLLGGWFVAEVVTASHQSEEFKDEIDHEFVRNQFTSTRDMHTDSRFWNYFWGGMQFQLIHHLFPTMPRYNYPAMVPRVAEFAKANGIEYRTAGLFEIWRMNFQTMKKFAEIPVSKEAQN